MIAIQLVSARIGRVTGKGVAANLREHTPRAFLMSMVFLLVVANTINIAADIAAMGEALQLAVGGGDHFHAVAFGVITVLLQVFVPYRKLAPILKWLTLFLFAYVIAVFLVQVQWAQVLHDLVIPKLQWTSGYWMMIVALLGTTISPYLFFWQASQEVEELRLKGGVLGAEKKIRRDLRRVKRDTYIGMFFSNIIAFFIMVLGGAVLYAAGIHDVTSAAQAAQALRPLAGDFAFALFAGGIIATGLLAVPVLASSAAYAVAEAFGWPEGLERHWYEAKRFYAIIVIATVVGTGMDFTSHRPDEGALLERRDQRRGGRAHHGWFDAAGRPQVGDGQFHLRLQDHLVRLGRRGGDGVCGVDDAAGSVPARCLEARLVQSEDFRVIHSRCGPAPLSPSLS